MVSEGTHLVVMGGGRLDDGNVRLVELGPELRRNGHARRAAANDDDPMMLLRLRREAPDGHGREPGRPAGAGEHGPGEPSEGGHGMY